MNDESYLVTGGGSGIGEATAEALIALGAHVTICGRRPDKIAAVAARLGNRCLAVPADVTQVQDREHLVERALAHGGGLNGLVSNAGNMYRASVAEFDEDRLLEIFNQNVVSGMMLSQRVVPALAARQGCIVFLGSIHTRRAFPGVAPYAATKAALQTLTQVMAAELGEQKVRVNCVLPGAVTTEINERAGLGTAEFLSARMAELAPMHALGRIGLPMEVADAIVFMLQSKWTTGALLDVDGGLGLGMTQL
ncbi:MAG: SDR family oxidoreductase [Pseudomonadales bacterium]|jgi:3-oxoacyl-[acyl-carrier protein] reductase|tara:strand:+ start:81 stop:833 length:753 start_codon:yes stop_codon:yes gene_type:complete